MKKKYSTSLPLGLLKPIKAPKASKAHKAPKAHNAHKNLQSLQALQSLSACFKDSSTKWRDGVRVLRVDIDGIDPDSGCKDHNYKNIGLSQRLLFGETPGDPAAPERFSQTPSVQDTMSPEGLKFFVLDENAATARKRTVRITLILLEGSIAEPIVIFQGPMRRLGALTLFEKGETLPIDTTLGHRGAAVADVDTFVRRVTHQPGVKNMGVVYSVFMDLIRCGRFVEADTGFIAQKITKEFAAKQNETVDAHTKLMLQMTEGNLLELVKPGGEFSPTALRESTHRREGKRPVVFKLLVSWGRVRELCARAQDHSST